MGLPAHLDANLAHEGTTTKSLLVATGVPSVRSTDATRSCEGPSEKMRRGAEVFWRAAAAP